MPIKKIDDPLLRPLSRLASQFRDKDIISDMISIFTEELFELQQVFCDLLTRLDVDTVEEFWLDNIGLILDEAREGDSDEVYRKRLKLKIFFNSSTGTASYVIAALRFLTGGTNILLTDAGLANLNAVTDGANLDNSTIEEVRRLLPATILLNLSSSFDGADFTTVDVDPAGTSDFTNPDNSNVEYSYYPDPNGGKWFQDYEELTTATVTINTAAIGAKHSVFINRNFVEFTSVTASTSDAATGLAALINAVPTITASAAGAVITVTAARFTMYAISQNTTMNPAYLSTYGGVMVDILERGFPEQDTNTGITPEEGLSAVVAPAGIWGETFWTATSVNGDSWNGAGDELTFTNASGSAAGNNIQLISATTTEGHVAETVQVTVLTSATGGFGDEIEFTLVTDTGETTVTQLLPTGTNGVDQGGGVFLYTVSINQTGHTGDFDELRFFQNNNQSAFTISDLEFI